MARETQSNQLTLQALVEIARKDDRRELRKILDAVKLETDDVKALKALTDQMLGSHQMADSLSDTSSVDGISEDATEELATSELILTSPVSG